MDTNINIIFQDGQGGGTPTDPTVPGATPNPDAPEQTRKGGNEKSNALGITGAFVYSAGRQALSAVTSRVGTVTRSNVRQAKINTAMNLTGKAISFGVALVSENYAALAMMIVSSATETFSSLADYYTAANQEQIAKHIQIKSYGGFSGVNRSR